MPAKKKAKSNDALVYIVLDQSGSMEAIRTATIEGINHFIRETQSLNPDALFSLSLFDTQIKRVYDRKVISAIEPIDGHTYQPGGGTALLDAVGAAVADIDKMETKPSKVVVAIMTDGQENASHEYTREAVKQSVSRHEDKDGWQFLFLGANLDSFSEAGAIGMKRGGSSFNWAPSAAGTTAAYYAVSMASNSYLNNTTPTASVSQDVYNNTLSSIENTASTAKPVSIKDPTRARQAVKK